MKKCVFLELRQVSLFSIQANRYKIFELLVDDRFRREAQLIVNEKSLFLKRGLELILERIFFINDRVQKYS